MEHLLSWQSLHKSCGSYFGSRWHLHLELTPWDLVFEFCSQFYLFYNAFMSTWSTCSMIPLCGLYSVPRRYLMGMIYYRSILYRTFNIFVYTLPWYCVMCLLLLLRKMSIILLLLLCIFTVNMYDCTIFSRVFLIVASMLFHVIPL